MSHFLDKFQSGGFSPHLGEKLPQLFILHYSLFITYRSPAAIAEEGAKLCLHLLRRLQKFQSMTHRRRRCGGRHRDMFALASGAFYYNTTVLICQSTWGLFCARKNLSAKMTINLYKQKNIWYNFYTAYLNSAALKSPQYAVRQRTQK